ncbi:hypothetical protein EDC01DRAFT_667815 [Geopyxis carbonaria]|nr:hypothetical protein EDC01DRAFT_667815 [Geopyxis carbonaria]
MPCSPSRLGSSPAAGNLRFGVRVRGLRSPSVSSLLLSSLPSPCPCPCPWSAPSVNVFLRKFPNTIRPASSASSIPSSAPSAPSPSSPSAPSSSSSSEELEWYPAPCSSAIPTSAAALRAAGRRCQDSSHRVSVSPSATPAAARIFCAARSRAAASTSFAAFRAAESRRAAREPAGPEAAARCINFMVSRREDIAFDCGAAGAAALVDIVGALVVTNGDCEAN